ncbi:MAG: Rrf2 family transcriptional regulator [Sedimentisphaerales bacterium]|jgi:Rrf2 family iron-sulfur cluster assembly transcriptional regulator
MDIIRRNTDYALRAAVELAGRFGGEPVSTKEIAVRQQIPYQLACKLMQRLHKAGIVKSEMGPSGGFMLCKNPSKITVRQLVETIQGPVRLNNCKLCRLCRCCNISPELARLQGKINEFLDGLTLGQLADTNGAKKPAKSKRSRSKK